ncbi:unnamed protein product [Cylicocyclus nassatus]|uniref:Uncharacterized protein n=1 Tax=Cylicocyclus nassatus TaxID=53992 RepID=A0AA36GJ93_CYLNA|nr:unnamed protein product [Cylicocyclus nassatus]
MTKTTARCYNIFDRKLSKEGTVELVERQLFVEGFAEDSDTAVRLIAPRGELFDDSDTRIWQIDHLDIRSQYVNITAIELDSVVVETAKKWFGVIEEENHHVIVQDGLEYLKEAKQSKRGERSDVIALDACDEAIRSPCPAKVFRDVEFAAAAAATDEEDCTTFEDGLDTTERKNLTRALHVVNAKYDCELARYAFADLFDASNNGTTEDVEEIKKEAVKLEMFDLDYIHLEREVKVFKIGAITRFEEQFSNADAGKSVGCSHLQTNRELYLCVLESDNSELEVAL